MAAMKGRLPCSPRELAWAISCSSTLAKWRRESSTDRLTTIFGESHKPSVSYWPSSSQNEQSGEEAPCVLLRRVQVRRIHEVELERSVPRLHKRVEVEDRVAVEV